MTATPGDKPRTDDKSDDKRRGDDTPEDLDDLNRRIAEEGAKATTAEGQADQTDKG